MADAPVPILLLNFTLPDGSVIPVFSNLEGKDAVNRVHHNALYFLEKSITDRPLHREPGAQWDESGEVSPVQSAGDAGVPAPQPETAE